MMNIGIPIEAPTKFPIPIFPKLFPKACERLSLFDFSETRTLKGGQKNPTAQPKNSMEPVNPTIDLSRMVIYIQI